MVLAASPELPRYALPATYNYAFRRDRERLPPPLGSVDGNSEGLAHLFLTDELGQLARAQPRLHSLVLREGLRGGHLHAVGHLRAPLTSGHFHSSAFRIRSSTDSAPPFSSTLRTAASAFAKL